MAFVDVQSLTKLYPGRGGLFEKAPPVQAVAGVSFALERGESLGLVGESGCGKSTLGRAVLRLHEPDAGTIVVDGTDVTSLPPEPLRRFRRHAQMIFQDPYASLNPRMTVGSIIGEALTIHKLTRNATEYRDRIAELLQLVGLSPDHMRRYPHEFSGGQRQRIGIARALAVNPKLVVCDEPVSALDVSIQAQIVNLMADLQERLGLTYVFVAHDLSVVRQVSTRTAVMYLGSIVEIGATEALYRKPRHPYTQALISAVPVPDVDRPAGSKRIVLTGDVPSPMNPPSGCRFRTRCPIAIEACAGTDPPPYDVSTSHWAKCIRLAEGR